MCLPRIICSWNIGESYIQTIYWTSSVLGCNVNLKTIHVALSLVFFNGLEVMILLRNTKKKSSLQEKKTFWFANNLLDLITICQSHQIIIIPLLWQFKNIFAWHYTHPSCNFFLWTFSLLLLILTSLSPFLVQTLLLRFHHLLPQLRILPHPWSKNITD